MGDDRPAQIRLLRNPRGDAIAPAAAAEPADIALVERGTIDQADERLLAVDERDQRREQRDAARESDRPVDRIDHPARPLAVAFLAVLLAEDAELGMGRAQMAADRPLGRAVRFGHGRAIELRLAGHAAEAGKDLATRQVRRLAGGARGGLEIE